MHTEFLVGKSEGKKYHVEDLGVSGRIIQNGPLGSVVGRCGPDASSGPIKGEELLDELSDC
jgi:hypothetical protein